MSLRRQRNNASAEFARSDPEADLRLVVQHEVAAVDRPAQGLLDPEAVGGIHQHRRLVEAQPVAAEFLRAEQRGIGGPQQRSCIAAVLGKHRHAAAHAHGDVTMVDRQRPLEAIHELLCPPFDLLRVARVRKHQREFVAAEPGDEAGLARDLPHALADFGQHPVAELVAEAVVHRLEVIEVEEHHREPRTWG